MPATEDYLRPLPKMHRWFAGSMIVLFVATLLMMYFDHHDEWRKYQKQWFKIEADKIVAEELAKKAELAEVTAGTDPKSLNKLEKAFAQKLEEKQKAEEAVRELSQEAQELDSDVKKLDNEYTLQMRVVRSTRADRDVARANYDLGIRDQLPKEKLDALKKRFVDLQTEVEQLEGELDVRDATRNKAVAELKEKTADRDKAAGELKAFQADIVRLQAAKDRIAPEGVVKSIKRAIMEWPIIDGFNSHMKIQQDWLPDMKITLGMAKTARFDRCRTCHLGIDRVGPGNIPDFPHGDGKNGTYEHPFSTHPRMDVYLSASSPHPLPEFGCTSCHDGQGSATSFQNASHTPNDPHQAHEWEHDFGWFNNHFWEYPMQPARLRESACLKCHHSVVELGVNQKFGTTAPKVYEGWQLIKKYGCFGCHEINGFDAGKPVGPDLRLEPQTAEEKKKIDEDPKAVAGTERKVGPSLRHIASKTTKEWLTHWTEEPKRFRPSTNMPQFFNLSNNSDAHGQKFSKLELAAIAHYLFENSQPMDVKGLEPLAKDYKPDAANGEKLFAQKGCLACHSHDGQRFAGSKADFGPNLSKIAAKVKPGPDGFQWLYNWIRKPEAYHARTRMPDLFLDRTTTPDGKMVDPAADIAAFLLNGPTEQYPTIAVDNAELDELVELLLARRKTVTPAQAKGLLDSGSDLFGNYLKARVGEKLFDQASKDAEAFKKAVDVVKGDEIELIPTAPGKLSDEEWARRKLSYLGRVTISRYGCYGCHDIPNFESARPIGTALQDWGLKDPSRLAPEHIEEYLHHHGEPDGSSTATRVKKAIEKASTGDFENHAEEESELGAAFFYESLLHHGRPGFIWQKLRDPRSYDYEKTETKFYDERLRMPKFPLNEREIEAISTFVLGLVARPPAEKYQYRPKGAELAKVEGEKLLQKFNCTGCHIIDLPEIAYGRETSGFSNILQPPAKPMESSKSPSHKKKQELQLVAEKIGLIRDFFQRAVTLADDVQKQSQLAFTRGTLGAELVLIEEEDIGLDSQSPQKWKRTIDRLQSLSKVLGKLPKATEFKLLSKTPFEPLTKQGKYLKDINARLDELLKPINDAISELDAGNTPEFDEKASAAAILPYSQYATVFAAVLDQLVYADFSPNDHLAAAGQLLSVKPAREGMTGAFHIVKREDGESKLPVMTFRGLPASRPRPDDEPEEREYGFDLWETLDAKERLLFPGARITVPEAQLVKETPARGGPFAEWLVDDLLKSGVENRQLSWQSSPPPLYLEGVKVQTPWLYSFLKNPYQIRHTTVLRMPRFNMSDAEAQALANYFAAYDGAPFPYQDVPQREPDYLAGKDIDFHQRYPGRPGDYLKESWQVIGAPVCSKCHAVGGRQYKSTDPKKDIRGPNLDHVANRLQPDWLTLWLIKPSFITPYTSMPVNFPPNQTQFPEWFGGNAMEQTLSVRDALLNYHRLMEREGKLPELQVAAPAGATPAEAKKSEGGGE